MCIRDRLYTYHKCKLLCKSYQCFVRYVGWGLIYHSSYPTKRSPVLVTELVDRLLLSKSIVIPSLRTSFLLHRAWDCLYCTLSNRTRVFFRGSPAEMLGMEVRKVERTIKRWRCPSVTIRQWIVDTHKEECSCFNRLSFIKKLFLTHHHHHHLQALNQGWFIPVDVYKRQHK